MSRLNRHQAKTPRDQGEPPGIRTGIRRGPGAARGGRPRDPRQLPRPRPGQFEPRMRQNSRKPGGSFLIESLMSIRGRLGHPADRSSRQGKGPGANRGGAFLVCPLRSGAHGRPGAPDTTRRRRARLGHGAPGRPCSTRRRWHDVPGRPTPPRTWSTARPSSVRFPLRCQS
jgi:hypothetical protein